MTALPQNLTPGTWSLDPAHTDVAFSVRHAGISKVRGSFEGASGEMKVGETAEDISVVVDIDAASLSTRNVDRDNHIKSEDFFDVEGHPAIKFVSKSIQGAGEDWTVVGDLTIKGQTHEVTLKAEYNGVATDPFGYVRAGFGATTTINRKDFGLTWNAALETGGVMLGEKISIEIDAEFVRQS